MTYWLGFADGAFVGACLLAVVIRVWLSREQRRIQRLVAKEQRQLDAVMDRYMRERWEARIAEHRLRIAARSRVQTGTHPQGH